MLLCNIIFHSNEQDSGTYHGDSGFESGFLILKSDSNAISIEIGTVSPSEKLESITIGVKSYSSGPWVKIVYDFACIFISQIYLLAWTFKNKDKLSKEQIRAKVFSAQEIMYYMKLLLTNNFLIYIIIMNR